ncbi:NtaA/DmoA family FMN-dependent monooxygenase [Nocardia sp. NPDC057227]|uniref:NtaA/DmoA family FMN-dependent monooxygenase n=1 Tax=Nocardia sp. NPDC057227 TaxID=3346056 RepID=UPI00364451FE
MTGYAHFTLLFTPIGVHPAAAGLGAAPTGFADWIAGARTAERGGIDAIFIADAPTAALEGAATIKFEPVTLLTALARETTSIGLIGTASTSFGEPYNVARQFASLQLLSDGRAGWNSVGTSHPGAAENFGDAEWHDHARRYRVGHEFTGVVRELWRAGQRPIRHRGEFFSVDGPLDIDLAGTVPPVICQAGGSEAGIRLAAEHADLTFAVLPDLAAALAYRARISEAEESRRAGGSVRVLPGVVPYLADTEAEARAYKARLDAAVDLRAALPVIARYLHVDAAVLGALAPDEPFPLELLPAPDQVGNSVATYTSLHTVITGGAMTTREVLLKASGGNRHREFVGTAEAFAADIDRWLRADGADGFTLLLPATARDLPYFSDRVAPVLRGAGLLPAQPATGPLRERFAG